MKPQIHEELIGVIRFLNFVLVSEVSLLNITKVNELTVRPLICCLFGPQHPFSRRADSEVGMYMKS